MLAMPAVLTQFEFGSLPGHARRAEIAEVVAAGDSAPATAAFLGNG